MDVATHGTCCSRTLCYEFRILSLQLRATMNRQKVGLEAQGVINETICGTILTEVSQVRRFRRIPSPTVHALV
jgi:hypothetical protein